MKKIAAIGLLLSLTVFQFASPAKTRRSHEEVASADVSVTKVDIPDTVNHVSNLTYPIIVKNNGADAAANASWSDTLPAETIFVTTATDSNHVDTTGTTIACTPDPIVTTNADSGAGSLRKAIEDACAGSTITFDMTPGHVISPITLTSGQLLISNHLTVQGPGANLLTVSGNDASRIFEVNSGVTLNISGLTIANGKVSGSGTNHGGGIINAGTLTVTNSTLSDNSVSGSSGSFNAGGGIYNSGTLNIVSSTLSHNSASGGCHSDGGGIFNDGTLTITSSTLSNNSVSDSSGCGGGNFGGGIYNNGTLTITNSTLSGNSVSSISFNVGGGIYNSGTLNIRSSTLSGNSVSGSSGSFNGGGGIFHNFNTLTITNSTLSGNSVSGGSHQPRRRHFRHRLHDYQLARSPVIPPAAASNQGGGIYNPSSGTVNARNTIIAGNTATNRAGCLRHSQFARP